MFEKKIEYTIIKVSLILACLIIGAGWVSNLSGGGTYAAPQSPNQAGTTGQTLNGAMTTPDTISPQGKVVAIGDSFTYGYPAGPDFSWVALAGQSLKREFVNAGKTGQTSADLVARFQSDVVSQKPSVVLITVGTGDALHGVALADYQKNIEKMIAEAKAAKITPVLGLPLAYPDAGALQLVDSYRTWLATYAAGEGIKVIDFNQSLYDDTGLFVKAYSDDGKYPNKQGYAVMAQEVEQVFTTK